MPLSTRISFKELISLYDEQLSYQNVSFNSTFISILISDTDILSRVVPSDTLYLACFDKAVASLSCTISPTLKLLRQQIGSPTLSKSQETAILAEPFEHYTGCSNPCRCSEIRAVAPVTPCNPAKPCHKAKRFPHVSEKLVKAITKDPTQMDRLKKVVAPRLSYAQVTKKPTKPGDSPKPPVCVDLDNSVAPGPSEQPSVQPVTCENRLPIKPSISSEHGLKRKTYSVKRPTKFAKTADSPMPSNPAEFEDRIYNWVRYMFCVAESDPKAAPIIQEVVRAAPHDTRQLWNIFCETPGFAANVDSYRDLSRLENNHTD